ncbi:major head protein [Rhodococcus phage ReqiPine5]|uniref:Gp14 n=1 Tax=Rhodococcus phage ReqiPine5 TaxID=691963 RepID=D4P7Y9_9CAUD|nr:major head protein [Rhodococcus phage ReqiPine5]ADD81119.1 gp14 [Rhodococcus phage ReqiPine5]
MFEKPEQMPTDAAGLADLKAAAFARSEEIRAAYAETNTISQDDLAELKLTVQVVKEVDEALATLAAADADAQAALAALDESKAADEAKAKADAEAEAAKTDADKGADETENKGDADTAADEDQEGDSVTAGATRFAGLGKGADIDKTETERKLGWEMDERAPGYVPGKVGFAEIARGLDSVISGSVTRSGTSHASRPKLGGYGGITLGRLRRELEEPQNSQELVAAIERATAVDKLEAPTFDAAGSLVAAGGWCAPSEQLYDFCDVPEAIDLISLPELSIRRGGVRWPVEPDLTQIFEDFQFFYTEPELEATDPVTGLPTAVKNCVEIPCPDEFREIRLNAVGYCVEAGILQDQGWPELTEWFMKSITAEHFRALSRRTVNDMVTGSTAKTLSLGDLGPSGTGGVLNALALMATNLRIDKGLGRTATIEGVAPTWYFELLRADMANRQGLDVLAVTDQMILSWLSARNIALQFVGDWQTRGTGLPGSIDTVKYPAEVKILLYPAGTWFRSLSNVVEFGVMYPKEQLQLNRYTRYFVEDAIAVGKRCNKSLILTIPTNVHGQVGPRVSATP